LVVSLRIEAVLWDEKRRNLNMMFKFLES